jgi:pyruvate,orthophosphate dikinase
VADFFSFGTNDLTQMVMGLSRDDAGKFLPAYVDERKVAVFPDDPFHSLDQEGVGLLVRWCIDRARTVKPDLKIGICGEHGGELESVKFCHRVGMDYVSCSPFRVPIARLAAAQAALEDRRPARAAPRPLRTAPPKKPSTSRTAAKAATRAKTPAQKKRAVPKGGKPVAKKKVPKKKAAKIKVTKNAAKRAAAKPPRKTKKSKR